jgi:hypothetical protein
MATSKVQYSSSQNYSPTDNQNSPQIYGKRMFIVIFPTAYHRNLSGTWIKFDPSSCVSWSSIHSLLKLIWSVPCTPFLPAFCTSFVLSPASKKVHKRRRLYPANKIPRHNFSDIQCGDDGNIMGFTLRRVRGIFWRFRMTCCFYFSVSPKRRNKTSTLRGVKTKKQEFKIIWVKNPIIILSPQ